MKSDEVQPECIDVMFGLNQRDLKLLCRALQYSKTRVHIFNEEDSAQLWNLARFFEGHLRRIQWRRPGV